MRKITYRLRGFKLLADVITGVKFKDDERITQDQTEHQDVLILALPRMDLLSINFSNMCSLVS